MTNYTQEPSWQQDDSNIHVFVDPLAIIYNEVQWRISNVSPMHSLQYGKVKFKQYASKIKQSIVSNVVASSALFYSVSFEQQPMLKYCEKDSDGLMITVSSSQENSLNTKEVYKCILLSWGVSSKVVGATHFPYLLERGEQKISSAVKSTLQSVFDCSIKQLHFTQHQLLQFGFNFIQNDSSRNVDAFVLSYNTPQEDVKDKLELTFQIGDVHIFWNGIKKDLRHESQNYNLISKAYKTLQDQIYYMIKMDVSLLDLTEVLLPKAAVKQNGVIKMKTPEIVNTVFTVLNEICGLPQS